MRRFVILSIAAACAWGQGLPKPDPQAAGFSEERLRRIHPVLEKSIERGEFAGIDVAIARHGKLAWAESFGYRDLEAHKPMQADTIFQLHSMTKPITSTAVMMLYEEGKFLLDDPVSKYLPGFDGLKVLAAEDGDQANTVPLTGKVTIHQLLTHTSGLSNSKAYQAQHVFSGTLHEMAQKILTAPLATQPGAVWRYGQGLDVLAYLVEVWSGKSYDVFLNERIFQPLGMKETAYFVPQEKLDRVSKVYQLADDGRVKLSPAQGNPGRKPTYFGGSGGLYSTMTDYLRFCQMLLNGGQLDGRRLLARETVDYMLRSHVPLAIIPPAGPNGRTGYGFGIGGAVLLDPSRAESVSAEGEFNWGGAAGTYFWIDRKNDLIAVWMVQRPPFVPGPSKLFKGLVYQALEN